MGTKPEEMALFKKLGKVLSLAIFCFVLLILAIQVNKVKGYLFNQAGELCYKFTEIGFKAKRVTGLFPIYLQLKSLSVYDKSGEFAKSELTRISWDMTALLSGDVHIRKLILSDDSEFMREPEVSSEQADTRTWFQHLRDVVADLPGLRVDELSAKSLQFGKQVFGNVRVVDIQASGQWIQGKRSDLVLDVKANTYSNDDDIIKLRWSMANDHLNVFAKITESPGGILSYLTESKLGRIEIDLNGRGDLSDWQGGGLINIGSIGRSEIKVENTEAGLWFKTKNFVWEPLPMVGQHFGLSFVLDAKGKSFQNSGLTIAKILFIAKHPEQAGPRLEISGYANYMGDIIKAKLTAAGVFKDDTRQLMGLKADLVINGQTLKQAGSIGFNVQAKPLPGAGEALIQFTGKSIAAAGKLKLAMNKLHIEQLQASSSNGAKLNITGEVEQFTTLPILKLQGQAITPEVEWVDGLFSAALQLSVKAHGPISGINLQANLQGKQAYLGDSLLNKLSITAKAKGGKQIEISGVIADDEIRLDLPGKIQLGDKISFQQQIKGPALLIQANGEVVEGALAEANVNFNCQQLDVYEKWLGMDLEGSLQLQGQLLKNGWQLIGQGQQLGINDISMLELAVKSSFSKDLNDISVDISAKDFDWQQVASSKASFVLQTKAGKGQFKLDIPARSKRQNVGVLASGSMDLSNSQAVLQQFKITPPKMPLSLSRPVTIKLSPLTITPVNITVEGKNAFRSTEIALGKKYAGSINIANFPLEFMGLLNSAWQMYGQLSGKLQLGGSQVDPNWQSNFSIKNLQFIKSPNSAKVSIVGGMQSSQQQLKLNAKARGDKGSKFDLNAQLELINGQLLDASKVKASFVGGGNMRAVAAFLDSGDVLEGVYGCNLKAAGTMRQPEIKGTISVKNGAYENLEYGTIIKDIQLKAIAGGRRLTLAKLQGRDINDGHINVKGYFEVPFRGGITFKLDAKLKQFVIAHSDFLVSKADGSITVERKQGWAVYGGLTLAPTIVNFSHMKLGGQVPMIQIKEKGQEDLLDEHKRKKSLGSIDLKLKFLDRLFIRGFGLNSQWKGTISLLGALNNPAVSGRMDMVKGVFLLLGNSMKLTKGSIKFSGETPINPTFSVKGERQTSYMTAYLTLGGNAEKPRIQLSSNPSYPQEEIISRILFGQEPGSLSPLQAFQLASIATSFKSSGTLSEKLGGGFGMKSLFPSGHKKSRFDTKIGDGLSDRVRVNLSPGVGQGANIEAQITDNVRLDADVGGGDPAAFGLSWVKRY